jgi:hypothetical protein
MNNKIKKKEGFYQGLRSYSENQGPDFHWRKSTCAFGELLARDRNANDETSSDTLLQSNNCSLEFSQP